MEAGVVRALFALLFAFAFVSSEAAVLWQFDRVRMPAFALVLGALLLAALARVPGLRPRLGAVPVLLVLLLAVILASDAASGEVDPLDYKVALVLVVLLAAPSLAPAFRGHDLVGLVWRLLTVYVLATALLASVAIPEAFVRGRADLTRFDFTGSLIGHTGLCMVYLALTLARLGRGGGPARLLALALLATLALLMVFLTATRTAVVTFALLLLLELAAARDPRAALARLVPLASAVLLAFALYTVLGSDDFLERLLAGSSEDWSSGRLASQLHWLLMALDEPFGLGFGSVRELLREGRPALDGTHLLEWPHNEPIRFLVEAGIPGLAFVLLLIGTITCAAVRAARRDEDEPRRALALAITADMLAQCLFQNYFNGVYHATVALLVLLVLVAEVEDERLLAGAPPEADGGRRLPAPAPAT